MSMLLLCEHWIFAQCFAQWSALDGFLLPRGKPFYYSGPYGSQVPVSWVGLSPATEAWAPLVPGHIHLSRS